MRRLIATLAVLAVTATTFGGACSRSDDGSSAPASTTTEETGASATSDPAATVGALQLCDAVLEATGPITEGDLSEISGVVASRDQPEVLWVHNDSGHPNEVWAIDHDGGVLGRFTVTGTRSVDWEDIALGVDEDGGGSFLYIGDIGDNSFTPIVGIGVDSRSADNRPVRIYRVAEPDVAAGGSNTERAVAFTFEYVDGPRDTEALLADPISGDVFVISKQWSGGPASLYRLPAEIAGADAVPDGITTLERVAEVSPEAGGLVTGTDISADGSLVALRSYGSVLLWDRDPATTLAETLAAPPTCTRSVSEPQGEAVAFGPDGQSVVTISEGKKVPLNWLRLPTD